MNCLAASHEVLEVYCTGFIAASCGELNPKGDKKRIGQDLQDHLDRRAFGLRVSRRRRKKISLILSILSKIRN